MVDVLTKTIESLDHVTEKKEKNSTKLRRKRSKSQGKRKSSRKDNNNDRSEELDSNGDPESKVEMKDNPAASNSQEFDEQAEDPDTCNEKGGRKGEEDVATQHHVAKVPSRTRKLFSGGEFRHYFFGQDIEKTNNFRYYKILKLQGPKKRKRNH